MKIENPKVFISYCWSNEKYIDKVVEFAQRLRSDGVDVLLDQFHMKLGNDTNDFMEKCVKDPSVTNVLILLSPDYKEKADARKGGAGIETQIISGEVYANVGNTKFIPVLFEKRGRNAEDCVPVYLKQRRWIDLSEDSNYEERYVELVKTLFGREKYFENPLGAKPSWVDDNKSSATEKQILVNNFKLTKQEYGIKKAIACFSNSLLLSIKEAKEKIAINDFYNVEEFEKNYSLLDSSKNSFLAFLEEIKFDDNAGKYIHSFFTDYLRIIGESRYANNAYSIILRILIHELFIETIAIFISSKNFDSIAFLTHTLYIDYCSYKNELGTFKDVFYSYLDSQICNMSQHFGKALHADAARGGYYLSGLVEYWRRHFPINYLSFGEFIDADCLLTNIAIASSKGYWFALSYCYLSNSAHSLISTIAISLKSKSLSKVYYSLFGWNTIEDVKKSINGIAEYSSNHELRLAYSGVFNAIPLLSDYIKASEIETID